VPLKRMLLVLAVIVSAGVGCARSQGPQFGVSFPGSLHSQPITGRVFVFVANNNSMEPRLQSGSFLRSPLFGVDVSQLQPGVSAVIDASTLGYPPRSLKDIPPGDYYVQALLLEYTEFHRSDGHTILAHMDQWEGQRFNRSPGTLFSEVEKVHLDPTGYNVKLNLTKVIPPTEVPPDTNWVKRIKMQSPLLSNFWGHPMYIGATILLPKDYDSHPNVYYPVLYQQGHFSLATPMGFATAPLSDAEFQNRPRPPAYLGFGGGAGAQQAGYNFYKEWISDNFPRMIVVTFQHPTPYFDDSYAVNSANNGPYGDAIMNELIPYLETHFRVIRKPYARVLSGGSTGGWESLALQVLHPDFFGGTWTFFPDPIDFHRYGLVDIYNDDNAFYAPGFEWLIPERPLERTPAGQVTTTFRQENQLEMVMGSHGLGGGQLEIWEAAYGPVGQDGYPQPLVDKQTGRIDRKVADYMRDHGYDLTYDVQQNWSKVGPELVGKIHVYVGDMDNYYLNLAVYPLEDFLKTTQNPNAAATFEYGRPLKGHGWRPSTLGNAELLREMADYITKRAPAGESASSWKYR
jgi:hypothetical protein